MKKVWLSMIFVILLVSCSTTKDRVHFSSDEELFNYLNKLIPEVIEEHDIKGISVAIVKDGQLFWSSGFGYSDVSDNLKVTENTLFGIGSITKLFTGVAIMQLVEDGFIDLDAPVKSYIPAFNIEKTYDENIDITVRNLLTHHSGIPDSKTSNMFGANNETFNDTVLYLNTQKTAYKPEEIWAYSNLAVNLLGIIIENVSGDSYVDYIHRNILDPLSMESSGFDLVDISMGYKAGQDETFNELLLRDTPAGGIHSSVVDLSNFVEMIFNNGNFNNKEILQEESIKQMLTVQNLNIPLDVDIKMGLSFFLSNSDLPGIENYAWHGGNLIYHHSNMGLLTKDKIGVIVLTNTDSGSYIVNPLSNKILKLLYEYETGKELISNKPDDFKNIKKVKSFNESIIGDYSTYYGLVKVYKDGQKLKVNVFNKDFDLVTYDNGWTSLEYKVLGFIPYKNNFLKNLYFKFNAISDHDVIVVKEGDRKAIGGVKIEPPILNDLWKNRKGEYELTNPDTFSKDVLIGSDKQIIFESNGYLYLGSSKGNATIVMPSSENEMYRPFLGRKGYETLFFRTIGSEEILELSGYKYRKIN